MMAQMKEKKFFPPSQKHPESLHLNPTCGDLIHEREPLTNYGYTGTTGRIEVKGGATRPGLTDPVCLLT